MCLTPEALRERMWGPFPALRVILESKKIPDRYYGFSTASDNIFEQARRIMEMSILVQEYRGEINEILKSDSRELSDKLSRDLFHLQEALQGMISIFFQTAIEEIEALQR